MTSVSVVVPTRNRRRLLESTLRSVLWQRDVDLEVIVVDEGCTDDTPQMLAAIEDRRVRTVRHDVPQGLSSARNHGAAEARGEWIGFVDDDDLWAPTKLASQLHAASSTGRNWAYTGSVSITHESQIVGGHPPLDPEQMIRALPRYNAIPGGGSNVIVHRSLLMEAGPFDTRLRSAEDWEMWIRLAGAGPPAWVCSPLMAYRVHASNWSLNVPEMVLAVRLIERLHETTVDWAKLDRWLAESYLRCGRRGAALVHFARAALRGEAANVVRDLGIIARRRVHRDWLGRAATPEDPAWAAQAACWLQQLERG